jgi:Protein of unknown function (DUF3015)
MRTRWLKVLGPACLALALGLSAPAIAGGDPGCGLGSMLWSGKKGMVFNLFASTTNGFLGTQTVGITLGTSGCTRGTVVALEHRLEMFVGSNADQLARDMALGEGETLTMVASLMEVAEEDRAAFYQLTQQQFTTIFSSEDVTAADVVASLRRAMADNPVLAGYVGG